VLGSSSPLRADNSNTQHTNDGNKMQAAYEALFQQYGVSIVVSGHVHAMEVRPALRLRRLRSLRRRRRRRRRRPC